MPRAPKAEVQEAVEKLDALPPPVAEAPAEEPTPPLALLREQSVLHGGQVFRYRAGHIFRFEDNPQLYRQVKQAMPQHLTAAGTITICPNCKQAHAI